MKKSERWDAKKPVGLWIRVSTEDQVKGDSPEHHEKRGRLYAESRGWDVIEVYRLEAVSGKSVIDHPQSQRMLKDVRAGRITGLIFSKLARLARNTKELLDFADIFREYDADLISLQESIDTSTPAGRLFYTMIAAMAQWEREEIADRISASVTVRARLGKPLNGKSPFGYVWQDKRLVIEPKEAPVRRQIYELFVEHRRKKRVCRILNDAGYRTRNGSRFTDTTIDRLIRDPTAKGLRRANYTKHVGRDKSWELKPEDEWIWSDVEPIVPEELWEQCNQILLERKDKLRRPGRKSINLFSGVAYCHCGTKMYVASNTPKYVCKPCGNRIAIADLEEIYYQQLKGFFLSPDEIAKQIERGDENIAEKEKLLGVLQSEQEKVEQEMQKTYSLYQDGSITSDGFSKFYRPLEERQKQLDHEIPQLEADLDVLKINHLSSDKILSEANDLYSRWPHLTRDEKQQIIESITEKIIIGKDEVAVNLCYFPGSQEMTTWQRKLPQAVFASSPHPSSTFRLPLNVQGERRRNNQGTFSDLVGDFRTSRNAPRGSTTLAEVERCGYTGRLSVTQ
jgi:site-specific DNA recombinase